MRRSLVVIVAAAASVTVPVCSAEPVDEPITVTFRVDVLQGPLKLLQIEALLPSGTIRSYSSEERRWHSEDIRARAGDDVRVSAEALDASDETILRCTITTTVGDAEPTSVAEGGFRRCVAELTLGPEADR